MTFSYSGNPADGNLDAVRFLIQDTNEDLPFLQDEEILWLCALWAQMEHVYFYAAKAAEAISAKVAREVSVSADGQSLSLSELQEKYRRLAQDLHAQYKELLASGVEIHAGGMTAGEQPDPTIAPFAFGTQMHDIYGAGQQDYGTRNYSVPAQWGEFTP